MYAQHDSIAVNKLRKMYLMQPFPGSRKSRIFKSGMACRLCVT